ncbi:septum formation inhibitor Maf [Halocola ammonii]
MKRTQFAVILLLFIIPLSCGSGKSSSGQKPVQLPEKFGDYWFQGKAEITSYNLKQARYGEMREGSATLIFVTEPFSRSKQVKLDNPDATGDDRVDVMKLNFTKKFTTGIYPYSMMTSVFGSLEGDHEALKVTTTSQEWCGHTFSQLNLKAGQYFFLERSYFESEGDYQKKIDNVWVEDELWTLIRLNPDKLPSGEISVIPGQMYHRLSHNDYKPMKATASIEKDGNYSTFNLNYDDGERILEITFVNKFPYEIESWQDTHKSGFGPNAKMMTTTATMKRRLLLDYWNKNSNEDSKYRKQLGLPE